MLVWTRQRESGGHMSVTFWSFISMLKCEKWPHGSGQTSLSSEHLEWKSTRVSMKLMVSKKLFGGEWWQIVIDDVVWYDVWWFDIHNKYAHGLSVAHSEKHYVLITHTHTHNIVTMVLRVQSFAIYILLHTRKIPSE